MQSKKFTFAEFLYLNTYAFLLCFIGGCIAFIPLYKVYWLLCVLQVILILVCLRGAFRIFSSWESKKREYFILFQRNSNGIRPDTFKEYMQAPCGRLLTKLVLRDLGKANEYQNLKSMRKSIFQIMKENYKRKPVIIHFADENKANVI